MFIQTTLVIQQLYLHTSSSSKNYIRVNSLFILLSMYQYFLISSKYTLNFDFLNFVNENNEVIVLPVKLLSRNKRTFKCIHKRAIQISNSEYFIREYNNIYNMNFM